MVFSQIIKFQQRISKIVQRNFYALFLQAQCVFIDILRIFRRIAFCQLQYQLPVGKRIALQNFHAVLHKRGGRKGASGHVAGNKEAARLLLVQLLQRLAHLLQHIIIQLGNTVFPFHHGNKLAGHQQALFRMVPPGQRLRPHDFPVGCIDKKMQVNGKLLLLQRRINAFLQTGFFLLQRQDFRRTQRIVHPIFLGIGAAVFRFQEYTAQIAVGQLHFVNPGVHVDGTNGIIPPCIVLDGIQHALCPFRRLPIHSGKFHHAKRATRQRADNVRLLCARGQNRRDVPEQFLGFLIAAEPAEHIGIRLQINHVVQHSVFVVNQPLVRYTKIFIAADSRHFLCL